jgi:type II secretory pathway component GspD/PulD (secretin)
VAIGGTASATLPATAVQPQTMYGQSLTPGLVSGGAGGGLTVSLLQGDMNVQAYLEALKTDTNSKIISNPRILVLNNQEATMDIIEEIPYAQSTTTGIGSGATSTTIAFKDVGIKLVVKPQISRDGMIILAVSPEDSYRTGEAIDGTPVVYTSRSHTVFMLENGETAVISGLVKENDSNSENKIPLLGDIPILGMLFKKVDKDKTRNELTILITAKIVK